MRVTGTSGRHDSCVSGSLGSLLQSKRQAAGLTLTQLALQLGVSRPYLSRLEHGEYRHPSPRVLTHLAKGLDISLEDLYALTGYLLPKDLPEFGPYLRAKHPDWPERVLQELDTFYGYLKHKHSLN